MDKLLNLGKMLAQMAALAGLLLLLSHGGVSDALGAAYSDKLKMAIEVGLAGMNIFGAAVAARLPSRRYRTLRDTQIQGFKYLTNLGLLQVVLFFLSGSLGGVGGEMIKVASGIHHFLVVTFVLVALMSPIQYIKSLFTIVKSAEIADPRTLERDLFT